MSELSRRNVLRAGAGAVVAVPVATVGAAPAAAVADGPVIVTVHDAASGELTVLHGRDELIVHDRDLLARILRAAQAVTATGSA